MNYGLQQTLILSVAIITAEANQTICIEEPELNLHSNSQKKLFDLMRSKKNNQFFLTTHSSIFTDVEYDVATYLINKMKIGSASKRIEARSDLILIKNS